MINRTTKASSTPSPVLLKDWLFAFSASAPVTATFRPSPDVPVMVSTNVLASEFEMLLVSLSKSTWRKPTVRSALMFVVSTRLPS
jgi:hypothetical protein